MRGATLRWEPRESASPDRVTGGSPKKRPRATAVQVVHSTERGSRDIEHIGSAHDDAELKVLKAVARQPRRTRLWARHRWCSTTSRRCISRPITQCPVPLRGQHPVARVGRGVVVQNQPGPLRRSARPATNRTALPLRPARHRGTVDACCGAAGPTASPTNQPSTPARLEPRPPCPDHSSCADAGADRRAAPRHSAVTTGSSAGESIVGVCRAQFIRNALKVNKAVPGCRHFATRNAQT